MRQYVGIDLGTTNSAICSYDGSNVRVWKSPEQNDVTPSAIYIDKRGKKYLGRAAYDYAAHSPTNAATLFKRQMGTSTPIHLTAVGQTMTPEECSAEILKVVFGYLPEEMRNDVEVGTVITVPAAFNQMQKNATMQAAELAGIGRVALMQEPVAAVMSVMRARNSDGTFLIYDLGGGTLDVAIAESTAGRVNLLAHGGISMCGGRDIDRLLVDNVVKPWLRENFQFPEDFSINPAYKTLLSLSAWAAEKAKIEISGREEAVISLSETETRTRDLGGNDVYLDITLPRTTLDKLIANLISTSINAARETISRAGISTHEMERIVFVGGPTNYKPLRDMVAFELGLPASTEVNPMTAVAEGASVFAESIDWTTLSRGRKSSRGRLSSGGGIGITFAYIARTPAGRTRIAVQIAGEVVEGSEFQIDSLDTGWTSGRMKLQNGATAEVNLPQNGENAFKVFVFDAVGSPISLEEDRIVITRTAASVDAIPASHSIAIEALTKLGGHSTLAHLVRAGEHLPKKGKLLFKAAESLKAGSSGALKFKLWEGEIDDHIPDNRLIGVLKITGADFSDGVIHAGADLHCEYEMLDSGAVKLEVSVPCIGAAFDSTGKNFYSRQEGQHNYADYAKLCIEQGESSLERLDQLAKVIDDPKLDLAREKLESAKSLDPNEVDAERTKEADENVLEALRLLAQVRKEHQKETRQLALDGLVELFNEHVRQFARPSEASAFDNLGKTAQRSIDRNDNDFEQHVDGMREKNFSILWRQDWFVVDRFKFFASSPHRFHDKQQFQELVSLGTQFLRNDDVEKLRMVVAQLFQLQTGSGSGEEMFDMTNIILG